MVIIPTSEVGDVSSILTLVSFQVFICMDNDQLKKLQSLTEDFLKESQKLINEGWLDRASANLAGLGGNVQGLGQKLAGHASNAIGNISNNKDMQKAGQSAIAKGNSMGYDAKYNAYLNSVIKSVVEDLSKLNIKVSNPSQLSTDIKQSIVKNTQPSTQAKPQARPVQKKQAPVAANPVQVQQPVVAQPQVAAKPVAPVQAPQGKMVGRKGYPQGVANVNYRKPAQQIVKKNNTALAANAPAMKRTAISEPKKSIKQNPIVNKPVYNMTQNPAQSVPVAQPLTYNYGKLTKPQYNHNTTFTGKDVSKG